MHKLKFLFPFFGLLIPAMLFGFTLTVTPTAETCSGNGTLIFASTNTAPGGSIEYFIYKLPNTTVAYASTTENMLGGLTSGDYQVLAIETVGTATTQQQQDVSISSQVVPLEFIVQSLNQACSTVSNISVNVTSGNAESYEIFNGPVTFPSQASNVFNNLPVGVYRIRVFDVCGIGVVSTFTVTLNPTGLSVSGPVFTSTTPPSCNFTVATQTITPSPGTVIAYPVTIQYTIHPPNGDNSFVINNTIANANLLSQELNTTLPVYLNQEYTYDIAITDACNTVSSTSFVSNQDLNIFPTIYSLVCNNNYFGLSLVNYTPPYTVTFSTFPAGFDPAGSNSIYPGPFNDYGLFFGDEDHPVPLGVYTLTVDDACGKSKTISFEILNIPPVPNVVATNNGCLTNSGKIVVNVPHYELASAIITSAPLSYPFPLPNDVTALIDTDGVLTLLSVPLGDYTIALTDFCNSAIVPVNVSIDAAVNQPLILDVRPGCELHKSSLKVFSGNASKLISLSITAAPAGFPFSLPYNGSANIGGSGVFFMNNLPAGNYSITATDECVFTNSDVITVAGYEITSSFFLLQTNCGTFDLALNFVSNGISGETFWLQKQLDTGWGHPLTDVPYSENTLPNNTNSYRLNNNATNFNLAFNGTFRIVRSFFSYVNGSEVGEGGTTDKICLEVLSPTLHFNETLEIIDAHRMPCSPTGNLDVIVDVNGALPLHFTITEKDGVPFSFDNGTSNVFFNLDAGVYTFQVEDHCGNIVNRIFDVSALGSLITTTKPDDLLNCVTQIANNETFDFTAQTPVILGTQSPADYTLNYYTSIADAQANVNAITNLTAYNPVSNPQTIYAGVRYNRLPGCYEVTSFDLFVGQTPTLNLDATYLGCDSGPVVVNASGNNLPNTTYTWSNGATGAEISITEPGITNLTVTATNNYGTQNLTCDATKDIQIIISVPPRIDRIDTADWTENENSISVITSNADQFEYSLDGNNFQQEPVFSYLKPGLYTLTVRDKLGCGIIEKEVWLLNYPKFFTPNGDGYNDFWFVENSDKEPNFTVEIFDRYGKLLKVLHANEGWDGKYNDRDIFSSDYWFVVHRQDGKIYKGHFALKR